MNPQLRVPPFPHFHDKSHSRLFAASNAPEVASRENILATGRAALAAFSLVVVFLDAKPVPQAALVYALLFLYVCLSFAFLGWVRWRPLKRQIVPAVHAADILFVAVIATLTHGLNSPFFVLSTAVVLTAAYRWGFWETVITGGIFLFVLLAEGLSSGATSGFDLNWFVMRSMYLSLVSILLGYLAEQHKQIDQENSFITRLLRICQAEGELTPAIRACLKISADFYRAKAAMLVIQENATHRVFRWQSPASEGEIGSRPQELDAEEAGKCLFWSPVSIWCWQNLRSSRNSRTVAIDNKGDLLQGLQFRPPDSFIEAVSSDSLLAAVFVCGDDLAGRLYILDPQLESLPVREMRYLSRLIDEVRPIAHNLYLWRKVRSRAHVIEQVRAAREIHDGIIQSLIGLELEIQALLLNNAHGAANRHQLERVQKLLREQSHEARDLMQRMKTPALGFRELIPFLENLVAKFGYETGIEARFVSDTEAPPLPAKACHEVARIVQEALVNVRKHTRATHVDVAVSSDDEGLKLIIEDDGPGSGLGAWRYEDNNNQERHNKSWEPAVIRERVLLLEGSLLIESRPGSGVRLVIRIPVSEHSQWWVQDSIVDPESRPILPSVQR